MSSVAIADRFAQGHLLVGRVDVEVQGGALGGGAPAREYVNIRSRDAITLCANSLQTFWDSFSALSKPEFATKCAFESS